MRRGKIGTRIAAGALALGLVLSLSPAPGALAAGSSQPSSWAAEQVNAAIAATVLMFETGRQRRQGEKAVCHRPV